MVNKSFKEIKSMIGADDSKEHLPSAVKTVAEQKEEQQANLKERVTLK